MIAARDLPRLRGASASIAVAVVMAGTAVWQVNAHRAQARQELMSAQDRYRAARSRYLNAQRDENLVRVTIDRFHLLEKSGMVGEEARLDWIERLRAAREAAQLPQLSFELRPRRELGAASAGAKLTLTGSTMAVAGRLPHEGRLLDFISALSAEPTALMQVRRCSVVRPDGPPGKPDTLGFNCELEWITVARGQLP